MLKDKKRILSGKVAFKMAARYPGSRFFYILTFIRREGQYINVADLTKPRCANTQRLVNV